MYIELHTSSAFSFLRAASLPETLIDRAATLGYPAVALLDRDGVSGAPRFHKAALSAGVRPLIGAELTIETGQQASRPTGTDDVFTAGAVCIAGRMAQSLPPPVAHEAPRAEG